MRKQEHKQIKVVHIMADGSVRDSVEGYPVPVNDITRPAYNILAAMAVQATASTHVPSEGSVAVSITEDKLSIHTDKKEA